MNILLSNKVLQIYINNMTYKENFKYMFENSRCDDGWPHLVVGVNQENLKDALDAIGPYNNFDPDTAYEAITKATKGLDVSIRLGREGSPVVYIKLCRGEKIAFIMNTLCLLKPDELDLYKYNNIRMWFD